MARFIYKIGELDITNVVESISFTGDVNQAARMCEFTIVFNPNDTYMPNYNIELGNILYVFSEDDTAEKNLTEIFRGVIFFRERDTSNATMLFTAYDFLIYLAKSKTTRTFKNITVENVITQVCNELGVIVGDIEKTGVYVDFVADSKSGIEIIKEALQFAYAATKKEYAVLMKQEKIFVIEKGILVEKYTATDKTNIQHTSYSESIEDMINQIMIVDKDGNVTGYITNDGEVQAYGMLQDIYKIDDKKDTQTHARAMLKSVARVCNLSAIGDIRCITGYSIIVQDEQLKGKFYIKSDRHNIRNNVHSMELELEFMEVVENGQ